MARHTCSICKCRFSRVEPNIIRHTSKWVCDECIKSLELFQLLKKIHTAFNKAIYWLNFLDPKNNKFVNDRIKAVKYITKIQKELEEFLNA